jgi:hypothetical protein
MAVRKLLRGVVRRLLRAGGPSSPREPSEVPVPAPARSTPSVEPPAAPAPEARAWYLDGQQEGWDATNPGTEPERRNLR